MLQSHIMFAQRVMRLARESGMNHVQLSFNNASLKTASEGETYSNKKVRARWAEEDDGGPCQVTLRETHRVQVPELPPR